MALSTHGRGRTDWPPKGAADGPDGPAGGTADGRTDQNVGVNRRTDGPVRGPPADRPRTREGEPAQASIGAGRGTLESSCQAIISGGRLWMVLDVPRRPGVPRHPTQKGLYFMCI